MNSVEGYIFFRPLSELYVFFFFVAVGSCGICFSSELGFLLFLRQLGCGVVYVCRMNILWDILRVLYNVFLYKYGIGHSGKDVKEGQSMC